jgi:hypothetical protein
MRPAKNNIVLIDCWQHLRHPLEVYAKENIQKFLCQIEGHPDWQVYVWNADRPMDTKIGSFLKNGNFNVALEFSDPMQLYHGLQSDVRYFYCGFHANLCLFYNTVGIDKYLQIADKTRSEFWVVSDCTMALDITQKPCKPDDLPWYNTAQFDENLVLTSNYRNQILKSHSILSTHIET